MLLGHFNVDIIPASQIQRLQNELNEPPLTSASLPANNNTSILLVSAAGTLCIIPFPLIFRTSLQVQAVVS